MSGFFERGSRSLDWTVIHARACGLEVLTPVAAIIGHNYSIFLIEKNAKGAPRLRGGAGGATCVGGSMGIWWLSVLIVIPTGLGVLYFVGYASLATISVALISSIVFAIRAWLGLSPWQYAMYGLLAEVVLIYALRPNIKRLLQGNERIVGFRARQKKSAHSSSSS
jgi:glycerol-3-phosphate acyltransferase PlsY